MKRIQIIISFACLTLLHVPLSGHCSYTIEYHTQNTARVPTKNIAQLNIDDEYGKIKQMINEYHFDDAIKEIQKQITNLRKRRKSTQTLDSLMAKATLGSQMIRGTEQVTFIDSVVVDKNSILSAIKIHPGTGTLDYYDHFFQKSPQTRNYGTIFLSELKDKIFFAHPNKKNILQLYSCDKLNQIWSEKTPLRGLEKDSVQAYPFVMPDGITLYYASKSDEGMGGYDIYVTRYNSDQGTYLKPENLGMPFNSPANDYLYIIDEINNLGWFASDRYQPEGKVCLYVFIPNETRRSYAYDENEFETIRKAALIHSIHDTWKNQQIINKALNRLQQAQTYKEENKKTSDFYFIVNDNYVYTSPSQFKNNEARELIKKWYVDFHKLQNYKKELEQQREKYAQLKGSQQKISANSILKLEQEIILLKSSFYQQEQHIRRLELATLGIIK